MPAHLEVVVGRDGHVAVVEEPMEVGPQEQPVLRVVGTRPQVRLDVRGVEDGTGVLASHRAGAVRAEQRRLERALAVPGGDRDRRPLALVGRERGEARRGVLGRLLLDRVPAPAGPPCVVERLEGVPGRAVEVVPLADDDVAPPVLVAAPREPSIGREEDGIDEDEAGERSRERLGVRPAGLAPVADDRAGEPLDVRVAILLAEEVPGDGDPLVQVGDEPPEPHDPVHGRLEPEEDETTAIHRVEPLLGGRPPEVDVVDRRVGACAARQQVEPATVRHHHVALLRSRPVNRHAAPWRPHHPHAAIRAGVGAKTTAASRRRGWPDPA